MYGYKIILISEYTYKFAIDNFMKFESNLP